MWVRTAAARACREARECPTESGVVLVSSMDVPSTGASHGHDHCDCEQDRLPSVETTRAVGEGAADYVKVGEQIAHGTRGGATSGLARQFARCGRAHQLLRSLRLRRSPAGRRAAVWSARAARRSRDRVRFASTNQSPPATSSACSVCARFAGRLFGQRLRMPAQSSETDATPTND